MPEQTFRESFLHYVWQYQYFNKVNLFTSVGESVQILSPGFLNKDAGPDFYNSKLLINNLEWFGTVEVHYKTSDWIKHNHTADKAYNSVILHLVWEEDIKIEREDGTSLPTLELRNRIDKGIIDLYHHLVNNPKTIPCEGSILHVDDIFITSMLERTLIERLQLKSLEIIDLLGRNTNNWEETCYQWLGKCFGFKINSEAFLQLCRLLPYSILKKYNNQPVFTEALLFGVSGFLKDGSDTDYHVRLKKEYSYLKTKHSVNKEVDTHYWKFLRLRPANFPTLRIAQFAAFISANQSITDIILHYDLSQLRNCFSRSPELFWEDHYHFNKESDKFQESKLGSESIDNLAINAIIPLRFAYGIKHDNQELMYSCVDLYKGIKPEKNQIVNAYLDLGLKIPSSFESQAYIHLFNYYCNKRECLSCTIGHQIIHPLVENDH